MAVVNPYLQVDGLLKRIGDRVLFDHISFGIAEGQRIGLIARNGTGKSTLLNIICGKDGYDEGNIVFRKDLKIGYLEQTPLYPDNLTVLEACFWHGNSTTNLIRAYEECMQTPGNPGLAELLERMDHEEAWAYEDKAKQILSKLKINDFNQNISTLSGGQLKRVALANVLITEPDLLILDLNVPGVQTPTSLLEELVRTNSALKILVLSGIVDQQNIMRVLQLGAAGFVPKSLDTDMLTHAIDFVLQGGVYIPTRLLSESQKAGFLTQAAVELAQKSSSDVHLTQRQIDVLKTLARGLPIKRICRELGLSEGTVKTHVSAIYRAFGATNRTEALIAARRAGFDITL